MPLPLLQHFRLKCNKHPLLTIICHHPLLTLKTLIFFFFFFLHTDQTCSLFKIKLIWQPSCSRSSGLQAWLRLALLWTPFACCPHWPVEQSTLCSCLSFSLLNLVCIDMSPPWESSFHRPLSTRLYFSVSFPNVLCLPFWTGHAQSIQILEFSSLPYTASSRGVT